MKLALILATLALSAPLAHAAKTGIVTTADVSVSVGYVDTARVNATATEPVRLLGEVASDGQEKQREINGAVDAFNKAKPADREALRQKAMALSKMNGDDLKKHDEEVRATLRKHLADVLAKLRAEHRLSALSAGPGVLLSPGMDFTDEAVKLLNAADADGLREKAVADANARAEAAEKRAREAEAKLVKAAPPVPPPVASRP